MAELSNTHLRCSQARGGPDQIVAASDHGAARRTGADHSCGDQMPRTSAGLLPYRRRDGRLEVFLVHPGGPFWAGKDAHAWSVAKGEVEQDEDLLHAAHREFAEETGLTLAGSATPLAPVRKSAGKIVMSGPSRRRLTPPRFRATRSHWSGRPAQARSGSSRRLTAPPGSTSPRLGARSTKDRSRCLTK